MNLSEVLLLGFTGLTAFGVLAAWWQSRPTLRISWGSTEIAYDEQETFPVLKATTVVGIANPSGQPDRFDTGTFIMHEPVRLRLANGESSADPRVSFFIWMSAPSIPAVSNESRWECRLTIWDAQKWMGKRFQGAVEIRTLRKTIRHRTAFVVPPIAYSPANQRRLADIRKIVEEGQLATEDPSKPSSSQDGSARTG